MAESQTLKRLIQELEYLIQLSSNSVNVSKGRISAAKDVMNVPSCQLASRNEPKQSNDTLHSTRDARAQVSFHDEEHLLEEEIKRILQDSTQSKAVGLNSTKCAPRINKDFIKINKQNIGLLKETPRDSRNSKGVEELASRLLQNSKVNELLLCEELSLRSQFPKHSEILMVLRDVYRFSTGSNRRAGKKEVSLKENFIERCNSSASKCDLEPELLGILNILLPHCGWVYGRNEIRMAKDLSSIKDTITQLEEKLHSIQCSFNYDENNVHNDHPDLICVQKKQEVQENLNIKDSPFWHPLVMSSVFQGMEMPPFLYYDNAREWISFQNAILELHEFYIQLKILKGIHPIITEVLNSLDSESTTGENSDGEWIKSLARLLKASAIMADFTGHLTVPILAGIKPVNESPTNQY